MVAKLVRERRVASFMTQDDLAQASGVSRPTIARIESAATTPRANTVKKLAKALHVEPRDLVPRPELLWGD